MCKVVIAVVQFELDKEQREAGVLEGMNYKDGRWWSENRMPEIMEGVIIGGGRTWSRIMGVGG